MRFDKKVVESGIVVTFTMVMTFSTVSTTGTADKVEQVVLDSREIALTAEPIEKICKIESFSEIAAKALAEHGMTATFVMEEEKADIGNEEIVVAMNAEEAQKELSMKAVETVVNAEEAVNGEIAEESEASLSEKIAEEPSEEIATEAKDVVNVETMENAEVSANEKAAAQNGNHDEPSENEEASSWDSKLMPDVEDYLNIRVEASNEAELAVKLYKDSVADILEAGEEWTKISSGNVEGYVKNEFCITGRLPDSIFSVRVWQ